LLGNPIRVFTDHKNNTFNGSMVQWFNGSMVQWFNGLKASDRAVCWLVLLQEYGVSFEYLPGVKNVVADALSRLDMDDLKIQEEEALTLLL
jgi:hypothetical protein